MSKGKKMIEMTKNEFDALLAKERHESFDLGQKMALQTGLGKDCLPKIKLADSIIELLDERYEFKKEDYD